MTITALNAADPQSHMAQAVTWPREEEREGDDDDELSGPDSPALFEEFTRATLSARRAERPGRERTCQEWLTFWTPPPRVSHVTVITAHM